MKWLGQVHRWCNKHEWIILLVLIVIIFRLPSLIMPHSYGDEEIYFVMGRAWKTGVPLYKAMFDHKPPLIYIMAGIAPTMFMFRGMLAMFMILHTILFWNLAKIIWAKSRPILAYLSSIIFVIVTTLPTFEGLTVNAELLMMVPVTAAVLLLWENGAWANTWIRPYRYILAGLLGGIGWLFKIPVAADMVAIGLFFFIFNRDNLKDGIKAIFTWSFLSYFIGFVAPLALTFVYYYLKGTGTDYLATVVTVNLGYVSSWSTSSYTFNPFKSGLVVRGVILTVFTLSLYLGRKRLDKSFVFASLWLMFSLFGALLSARPYPHYLQELAAPFALLIPFIFVAENIITWIFVAIIIVIGTLTQKQIKFWAYPTVPVYKTYWEYVTNKISWSQYLSRFDNATKNYDVAKYLNERLGDNDKIYIWGTDPTIYNLTNRLPTGGKYIVSFHVRDLNKYAYVMENLNRVNPDYIVVLPNSGEFADLEFMIKHKYVQVREMDGIIIYMRLP